MRRLLKLLFCPNVKAEHGLTMHFLYFFLAIGYLPCSIAYGQCSAQATKTSSLSTSLYPTVGEGNYGDGILPSRKYATTCVKGSLSAPSASLAVAHDYSFDPSEEVPLASAPLATDQLFTSKAAASYIDGVLRAKVETDNATELDNAGNAGSPARSDDANNGDDTDSCLEALPSGECQFRIQIDTSAATGNTTQTNTSTKPNILVTLDYLCHSPQDTAKADDNNKSKEKLPHLAIHLRGRTGFTQTFAASSVQPTATNGGTAPPCPSNSKSPSSSNCMLAVGKPAVVGEIGGKIGGTSGVDSAGFYSEFGVSGRGSFQYLIPADQIVQNSGATYIDLNSTNPHNVVGFYEIAGYAEVVQHDQTRSDGKAENSSPLLVVEGGYQNNRALQQLLPANFQSTRGRYVGRFSFNYEVSKSTHSQVSFGVEYSGGINGGPHVVQLFIGGNLNPAKLFNKGQ